MRILIDIGHPAHLNFFKHAINLLGNQHEIIITYLDRGRLPVIVETELSLYEKHKVGKHNGTYLSIIFQANIFKFFALLRIIYLKKIEFGLSAGSFTLGAALKVYNKKNIQFDDDPERKVNVLLEKLTSDKLFFPPIIQEPGRIENYNALKEWAYLSPTYLTPKIEILRPYKLEPRQYIFAREVSTRTLNYQNQDSNIISSFASQFPQNFPVVLSLEDKTTAGQYPKDWILLNEPVEDIHSLMYYSKVVISSGDSIAREGAMLGVPSIYCGFREMKANQMLIERKMLFKKEPSEVKTFMASILNDEMELESQEEFRKQLLNDWIDVTQFILDQVKKYQAQ